MTTVSAPGLAASRWRKRSLRSRVAPIQRHWSPSERSLVTTIQPRRSLSRRSRSRISSSAVRPGPEKLTPPTLAVGMVLLLAVLRRRLGMPERMAVRGVTASLSRTGVASAALTVAVAALIGRYGLDSDALERIAEHIAEARKEGR